MAREGEEICFAFRERRGGVLRLASELGERFKDFLAVGARGGPA